MMQTVTMAEWTAERVCDLTRQWERLCQTR